MLFKAVFKSNWNIRCYWKPFLNFIYLSSIFVLMVMSLKKLGQTNFFKKNFGKCFQIECFKVKNSIRKTLTRRQPSSKDILHNKRFMREITRNLAHQSPWENMHKVFDYIRTPLKTFLACLTFHRKEIRLCISIRRQTLDPSLPPQNKDTEVLSVRKICLIKLFLGT